MYTISEKQIDFILHDIRRNGVEMEDLQLNLLDHICCIIEQELDENGDFEQFYFSAVKKFYKNELREIEEETISLLTYKNYYVMKKIMILSGTASVSLLTMGIILKFLHQPGAAVGIVLGIGLFSLVFLPLVFTLKIKEKKAIKDKILIGIGALAGILLSTGVLFKVMHWPGANKLSIASIVILMLLFLPVYFFTGIRNAETKMNTIVSSLLIITGCGLFLTLVRSPYGSKLMYIQATKNYLFNEQLLDNEQKLFESTFKTDSLQNDKVILSKRINGLCEDLKTFIIQCETGQSTIDNEFEKQSNWLEDSQITSAIENDQYAKNNLENLRKCVSDYNNVTERLKLIPIQSIILDNSELRTTEALNGLIQIQMYLLQNERILLATK